MFIKLEDFSGIVPRLGPTELQANQAQIADNVLLASSELRPWGGDTLEYAPTLPSAGTIYKLYNLAINKNVWCTWQNDINVVSGQISDTTDFRLYYTGDGPPKKTNWRLATSAQGISNQPYPNSWYFMGIPNPVDAPTLTATQTVKRVGVTNAGVNYTSAPTVGFTGGGGTGAVATATLSASVSAINITAPGAGYATKPLVQFSGGGGGQATAEAILSSPVKSVIIYYGGANYSSPPTVAFTAQPGDTGSGATGTAVLTDGAVSSITITNGGSGYAKAPTVTFSGGVSSDPALTVIPPIGAAMLAGGVQRVNILEKGTGYSKAPMIEFLGAADTKAVATSTILGGVGSVSVTASNADYSSVPDVTFTGGGGTGATATADFGSSEVRAYVYTYVNTFGSLLEETGPSPAELITVGFSGAAVTISGFSAPPSGMGYNVTAIRIYRTITGSQSTVYGFVAEIPIAETSYVDMKDATQLGESLTTTYFQPPPDTMRGIVAMPNGMFAGFTGNEVWFCEPYLPHAWPARYSQSVTYPIIGLGVFGSSLVVLTTGEPFIMTGTSPDSITQEKLSINQPCVAKRSIVSDQYGVLYASPFGLVSIGPGTRDVITTALFTSETWRLYNPDTINAAIYNNRYVAFYIDSTGNVPTTTRTFVLTRGDTPPLVDLNVYGTAIYNDISTGALYYVSIVDSKIYRMNDSSVAPFFFRWKSKKFVLSKPTNFSTLKVQANFGEVSNVELYNKFIEALIRENLAIFTAANGRLKSAVNETPLNTFVLNGSILLEIPTQASSRTLNVFIYGDERLLYSSNITSQEPVRLPTMEKKYVYEVELTGNLPVRSFIMATSTTELREVGG